MNNYMAKCEKLRIFLLCWFLREINSDEMFLYGINSSVYVISCKIWMVRKFSDFHTVFGLPRYENRKWYFPLFFSLSSYHIHGVHSDERASNSPERRRRNRAMSMNLENFSVSLESDEKKNILKPLRKILYCVCVTNISTEILSSSHFTIFSPNWCCNSEETGW